jgi:hypothetical protein
LGAKLGTSKSMRVVRVPSEVTPGKRDIVFDQTSHNPKAVGSSSPSTTNSTDSLELVGVNLLALHLFGKDMERNYFSLINRRPSASKKIL